MKKNIILSRSVIVSSFIFILSVLLFSVMLVGCTSNNYGNDTGFTTMNNDDEVSVIEENSETMSNEANIPDAAETYETNENSSAITVQWNSAWVDKEGVYHPNLEGEWHTLVDGDIPTIANIYIPPAVELVPRITFTNDRIKSPDLWVAKTVAVAMEGWEAPDTDFRFTLKLDGVLAKDLTYQVFDDTGTEIFNMVDPSTGAPVKEGGVKAPWKTDRSGEFTLKANQRAKFEWVGSGVSYEVTEWETPNYTQLLPEGGVPAKGVVTDDGALAAFGNLYVPEDEAELTKLSITKNVAYPTDLQCPDTPDFKFFVEVDGEPYALENYVLSGTGIDAQSDNNGGTTDENGSFTLKAGQTATFSNVPVGVDYKVYEDTDTLSESGWRAIGKSSLEGSTKAPLTLASFANATASFGVTKSMDDDSHPDTEFEFVLTDGDMQEWYRQKIKSQTNMVSSF